MLLHAHAKLNWTLDVLYRRTDGYHELDTLMAPLELCDELIFKDCDGIAISCPDVPQERNTAYRAAKMYFSRAHLPERAHITIKKHIPVQAGLGGASADAAAVLRMLEQLHGALGNEALYTLAREIGTDVPFCLYGKSARCRGIGEKLTPLTMQPFDVLLVKPRTGVSTRALFCALDTTAVVHPDTAGAMSALCSSDIEALGALIGNALITHAIKLVPRIEQLLTRLKLCGALGASMSGSGSCCFGLFATHAEALKAQENFTDCDFALACRTI